ncbi:MAG: flavodoxin family protein [Desulfobulbaceae bacterium]|jgi:multimeric flavodoxin WrbA|nr:flavodoxin family protein [Desulfobulbaceae bacterium]
MNVLGISGSPRRGKTTDQLVQHVLAAAGHESEFISLAGKQIGPCSACMACVKDNICKINDDMGLLREKILAADGLVIGAPNYFSALNALSHCFLERLCQFRHRDGLALAGKHAVIVSTGGIEPEIPAAMIEKMLPYYQIHHVGTVTAQGAASCFTCGQGETCSTGAVRMLCGEGVKITDDLIPDLSKQPDKIAVARDLGQKLGKILGTAI